MNSKKNWLFALNIFNINLKSKLNDQNLSPVQIYRNYPDFSYFDLLHL